MNLKQKSNFYSILGILLGFTFGGIAFVFIPASDEMKLIIAIVTVIIVGVIFQKIAGKYLLKHISQSDNPRKEFWKLFMKNSLGSDQLDKIPEEKHTMHEIKQSYSFFDKRKAAKKIRLAVNSNIFRFQNSAGRFVTLNNSDIKEIIFLPKIISDSESGNVSELLLKIILKNNMDYSVNISNINCEIDELEQILEKLTLAKIRYKPIQSMI